MSIESIEKRARRIKRMKNDLSRYQHALRFFGSYEALSHIRGLTATWDAVRRVATALVQWYVADVATAWAIARYVNNLPDGPARLKVATEEAVAGWQREIDSIAPVTQEERLTAPVGQRCASQPPPAPGLRLSAARRRYE
jgi:hypothetical protein